MPNVCFVSIVDTDFPELRVTGGIFLVISCESFFKSIFYWPKFEQQRTPCDSNNVVCLELPFPSRFIKQKPKKTIKLENNQDVKLQNNLLAAGQTDWLVLCIFIISLALYDFTTLVWECREFIHLIVVRICYEYYIIILFSTYSLYLHCHYWIIDRDQTNPTQ